ncbi:unnamed protein product [Peronospora belbahrii]|uniref:Uncharacterized protein n=1 Tax=Peronospora belbahrii TaxID=622444 RepID=A0ABN8D382_9STRA|nr:unnamed protein product [Peronospora belbahrii]
MVKANCALQFAQDHSMCSVFPSLSSLAMHQKYTLTTKEISGDLELHSFPIPLSNALKALTNVMKIYGRNLLLHGLLLSPPALEGPCLAKVLLLTTTVNVLRSNQSGSCGIRAYYNERCRSLGDSNQVLIELTPKPDYSLELPNGHLPTSRIIPRHV